MTKIDEDWRLRGQKPDEMSDFDCGCDEAITRDLNERIVFLIWSHQVTRSAANTSYFKNFQSVNPANVEATAKCSIKDLIENKFAFNKILILVGCY